MEKLSEETMTTLMNVRLNTIDSVKLFCERANICPCKLWLESDTYKVDAKSLMGIFSLDTSKSIALEVEDGAYASLFSSWQV